MDDFRHWLVRRIEIETRAFHNADYLTRDIRWGRVLAYLEVGVRLGYWSERTSSRVSDSIHYGRFGEALVGRCYEGELPEPPAVGR